MSCILLLICLSAPAIASEHSPDDIQSDIVIPEKANKLWFDSWQQELTQSMDYTARQLDSFFAVAGSDAYRNARAEGRVSLGWEPRSRDLSEVDLRFRVRVKLPALEDRVDLVLSDSEESDSRNAIKAARVQQTRGQDNTTIALRYKSSENARISHRLGTGRRGQIYGKSRFQDVWAFNQQLALFYDTELYYYNRDGFGAEAGATLQYLSTRDHVFRFNNRYYYRDDRKAWFWRHDVQYLQPVSVKSAVIYTLYTEGTEQPHRSLTEIYSSVRYRTNPTRDWLFYEVEPFVLWLKDEDFKPSYGIALRVEVYYGKDT